MEWGFQTGTANDNEAPDRFPRGDAVGFRAHLRDKQIEYVTFARPGSQFDPTQLGQTNASFGTRSQHEANTTSLTVSLLFWAAAMLAFVWSFYTSQSIGVRLIAAIATIWTALWTTYLAQDYNKPRLSELAILSALAGFLGMLVTGSMQLGLPLQTSEGFALFAGASIIVSALMRSPIALTASISACLFWAAMQFDGYLAASFALLTLPVMGLAHVALAMKFRSGLGALGAVLNVYVWIGGTLLASYNSGIIPAVFALAGIFTLVSAHYHISKAADDKNLPLVPFHTAVAWGLALLTLSALQHYYINPSASMWAVTMPMAPAVNFIWIISVGAGILMIAFATFARHLSRKITLSTAMLITLLHMTVPMAVFFEAPILSYLASISDVTPRTAYGLFLGGIILGCATVFALNNLRRERYVHVAIGLMIVGIQSELALKSEHLSFDHAGLTLLGLLLSVFAFVSFARHPQPPKRIRKWQISDKHSDKIPPQNHQSNRAEMEQSWR